jgi:hypothetical protein
MRHDKRSNPVDKRSNPKDKRSNPVDERSNALAKQNITSTPAYGNELVMRCADG